MVTAAMKLKTLTPWKKIMTNLDSILKSRDITLPTKFCLVKAMVFPVVMYGCEKSEESESEVSQSCPTLCNPWTVPHQAPPSMGFTRQECWKGVPFPSPGDLPDPGIKTGSPTFQADALTSEPPGKPLDVRIGL